MVKLGMLQAISLEPNESVKSIAPLTQCRRSTTASSADLEMYNPLSRLLGAATSPSALQLSIKLRRIDPSTAWLGRPSPTTFRIMSIHEQ